MMALNGEVVSDRAQHRIRKMVENHFFIAELQGKFERVTSENKQLKQQVIYFLSFNVNPTTKGFTKSFDNKISTTSSTKN